MDYSVNKNIFFKSKEHEEFFYQCLAKSDRHDEDYQALFYCLGIDRDTRDHIDEIYNFDSRTINPECLNSWWIVSANAKVLRMSFNLFCLRAPSVDLKSKREDKLREYEKYTPEDLFCCNYAIYFMQTIILRYPHYCA